MSLLNKNAESRFSNLLLLFIFFVVAIGATLIYLEIHQHNMIQKSKFSFELIKSFEADRVDSGMAEDMDDTVPISIANKGHWNDSQIDHYLSFFELLKNYVDAGSLNVRDVFDYYSDNILEAYHNRDIQSYIHKTRAMTKDSAYYERFEAMAKQFEIYQNKISANE
jgi:hypothetical protein